ncbi:MULTISPECIES: sugar ABC transporter substrate-binding protein [Paenibacillus]|uniref:Extracellular solute-binding protein family 1 n=2 Tax=Paenibacillus lactis TaxID=228574 RepID=G4H8G8_9BACL|nr:sugar ABC transporter substrate-binding protein [Paenibacillus lactis]EHB68153.1 extracellular solute-binding protein family 1 [Paenibacillus lactis 154]MBP1892100.1 multiple sugar transport system substrate-binding protein [Paenibacillus lactis]MCM3492786.1 sugar ABC transporter substrate-binding protein [Paenibacillus lactis]GIO89549.1 ABC transporter substrate-binding protein [Paenibacillus lactis]HAF99007.1 sugar ABC transporter substrate-binding protein [Paenibacillus lactis]
MKLARRFCSVLWMAALMMLAAGCSGIDSRIAESERPMDPVRITAYMAKNPVADILRAHLPEFEEKTGIQVDFQALTNEQLSQKMFVQMTVGSESPDVFMIRPLEELSLYESNDWLAPLESYAVSDPRYDFADFSGTALESVTVEGKLLAVPLSTEQQILFYRKDLLEKQGIEVPQTLDELEEAVKQLHDPEHGVYGFVARGQRSALVTQLSSFIYSEGGNFLNEDQAALNTEEALKGMKRYVNLLRNYGPPDAINFSWPQSADLFAQGKAAFFTDASAIYSLLSQSGLNKENIGYAMFPAGDAGRKPYSTTAWGIAMNANSPRKEAAWAFIEWASGREMVLQAQKIGNPGARSSLWRDEEGISGFPEGLIPIINESIPIGMSYDRPKVIHVKEARDIIGSIVVKGLVGEDIEAAAESANVQLQELIDSEK